MSPSLMASTRRPPPLQVFQDPDASLPSHTENEVESALLDALRPMGDASNRQNVHLNPTTTSAPGSSPTKTDSSPLRPMATQALSDVKLPPPPQPSFVPGSPRKTGSSLPQYHGLPALPEQALYSEFSTRSSDKENTYDATAFSGMSFSQYSDTNYPHKGPMKRSLPDSAPLRDRSSTKKVKIEKEEPFELPDPTEMPAVVDDGSKPAHSYAELIGMAILRAPNRRLTLAQIYKWISDNFAFYKTSETGWQNSIRHNLSLNKNFIKQERPKDDPGKGNYWAIKPGEERPYLLGKKNPIRRITNPDGSAYPTNSSSETGGFRPSSAPAISHFTLAPNPIKKMENKAIDSAKFPDEAEFSSDGTIPASDPALQDDDKDDSAAMPPPPSHFRSSPPPADIGSSPPPMASAQRKGTPPPVPRFHSTSRSGGRRQKFAALNDSGYWSSIESSAARGAAHQLTSEADVTRSRIRKGRAEEEIARIRSSSFDSPSKDKTQPHERIAHFCSSSPLKDENPLTPAVVFKRPVRPPPSISPNTNLRNHRNRMRALLGSPAKTLSPLPEMANWSPAFNLADEFGLGRTPYVSPFKTRRSPLKSYGDSQSKTSITHSTFDVFIEAPEDMSARGSPEKRANRRPSLARAATSAGILADITGTKSNATTPTEEQSFSLSPFFTTKLGGSRSPTKLASPLKQSHLPDALTPTPPGVSWQKTQAPTNDHNDANELFGADLPNSDGTEEGIDIFQDFGKIGQPAGGCLSSSQPLSSSNYMPLPAPDRATGSPVRKNMMGPPPARARPGISRSLTSRW